MARPPILLAGYFGDVKITTRFLKYVRKTDTCWEWDGGSKDNHGFQRAQFRLARSSCYASRAAYALFKGDVPARQLVLHTCDNGMCVNPEHLYLGDHKRNTADMMDRGRSMLGRTYTPGTFPRGYKRPFMNRVRKLTDDMVRAIRKDDRPLAVIALQYGVRDCTISNIKTRKRKAHVPD